MHATAKPPLHTQVISASPHADTLAASPPVVLAVAPVAGAPVGSTLSIISTAPAYDSVRQQQPPDGSEDDPKHTQPRSWRRWLVALLTCSAVEPKAEGTQTASGDGRAGDLCRPDTAPQRHSMQPTATWHGCCARSHLPWMHQTAACMHACMHACARMCCTNARAAYSSVSARPPPLH